MTYNPMIINITCDKSDEITNIASRNLIEDLAFTHWQYKANEKAYEEKLITKTMYEYAREELRKSIDKLSKICYSIVESG